MIARVWHGATTKQNAAAYENLLRTEVFPEIARVPGSHGAELLRRDDGDDVAFITICYFESLAGVKAFAGGDYEKSVIRPEAHRLLKRFDERAKHYEVSVRL
jgi:hypothetical protein